MKLNAARPASAPLKPCRPACVSSSGDPANTALTLAATAPINAAQARRGSHSSHAASRHAPVNAFGCSTIWPKLRNRVRMAADCASVAGASMIRGGEFEAA
jgi:hypothetical protein